MTMMMWLTLCRPPWASASLDPVKERKRTSAHNAALSARCMVTLPSRNFLFDFDKGNDCIPISPVPGRSKSWMRGRTGLAILYLPTDGGEGDPESPLPLCTRRPPHSRLFPRLIVKHSATIGGMKTPERESIKCDLAGQVLRAGGKLRLRALRIEHARAFGRATFPFATAWTVPL